MARNSTKLPASPCNWGAYNNAGQNPVNLIRNALGIKGTKIPANMHGEWNIDGWKVVVKRHKPSTRKYTSHTAKARIFVRVNGELIPAGRVRQALCRVDVHQSRKTARRHRGAGGKFTYKRR